MQGSVLHARPDREPLPVTSWYVACATAELGERPIARRVHDLPLVLFRGEAGPIALYDRCPHRGVALSLGEVKEGRIACAYHGWRFGTNGVCAHIPSLTEGRDIAAGISVRSYPCAEQDGYVWVWPCEEPPKPSVPSLIPGFAEQSWVQGALELACEAMLPIENNLDFAHPYFTHPHLHPQWFVIEQRGFKDNALTLAQTPTGLEVTAGQPGHVRVTFDLPDRVTIAGPGLRMVLHHTPTAPGRCRQHWLFSTQAASPEAPRTVTWTDERNVFFEQDRRIMESAQLAYAAEGDAFERSVEADTPSLMARRLVRASAAGDPLPAFVTRQVWVRS